VLNRPDDLADDELAVAVAAAWDLPAVELAYAAVGFGSHHWTVSADATRAFLTVDDLSAKLRGRGDTRDEVFCRLERTFRSAAALAKAGLEFVVAPVPTTVATVLQPERSLLRSTAPVRRGAFAR
jgi:spectinomycin phosphotransferase/16S rRNA (guanine(1405)-N(7))-methyltransferase